MVRLLTEIFIILLLIFLASCYPRIILGDLCDDKLKLEKKNYYGNELRIDGYYYKVSNGKCYSIYFFYNDGTLLYGGGGLEFYEHEKKFIDDAWVRGNKDTKYLWGLFKIEGNTIAFERWYPSSGGPLEAGIREGEILNDTTFRITKYVDSGWLLREERTKDEIYHFRQFSPKPDSTNRYIK